MAVPPHSGTTRGGKKRAVSLDLARGAMLLLIALAHAPLYLYNAEPGVVHRVAGENWFDHAVNLFGLFAIDNRARAMFAVLFGYGLVLAYNSELARSDDAQAAARAIRRRCLYLIGMGVLLAVVIGGQDILMAYGLAGLLVRRLLAGESKPLVRTLTIVTALYVIITPIFWGITLLENGAYGFAPEYTAADTYWSVAVVKLLTLPLVPLLIHAMFPVLPSVLLGMWMAKYKLLTKPDPGLRTLRLIAFAGMAVSLAGALPLAWVGKVWQPGLFAAGLSAGVHVVSGMAGGAAYAALFGLIGAKLRSPGRIAAAVMALGKRSLTFFVWNEALLVLLLSPVAFDLGGRVSNGAAALIAVGVWGLSVLLAAALEKKHKNGPLETLLRRSNVRRSER